VIVIDDDSPPAKTPSAAKEPAVADASTPAAATAPAGSFGKIAPNPACVARKLTSKFVVLGPRLQSLNIFEININRWYEAKGPENVRAVIGIMKGQKYLPEETRKRRRLDGEEDE
jgi:hypothetical protein